MRGRAGRLSVPAESRRKSRRTRAIAASWFGDRSSFRPNCRLQGYLPGPCRAILAKTRNPYRVPMAIDLRHLRYFIAVAEEGHITRAAERLGMQQPPLSQQIKAMERQLDVQLFLRKPRGVELTEAGRALLEDAHAMLAHLDRALETPRRTARGEQGRISVGMTPTAPFHPLVPRAVRAFREAFPLVSLTLEESLSHGLLDRLRNEQMDVAFIRNAVADPAGLLITPLLD